MLRNALFCGLLALATAVPSLAKIICTNSIDVGTFVLLTTSEENVPPVLSYLLPGAGSNADTCLTDPDSCTALPCLQTGCVSLPYNTGTCLKFLVSQCGLAAPVIRQVEFLSSGACP